METRGRGLRVAAAIGFILACSVGPIADSVSTTSLDATASSNTANRDYVKCNQVECTQACDRSAPSTGHCRNLPSHLVMVTTLECCCCSEGTVNGLRFYPFAAQ